MQDSLYGIGLVRGLIDFKHAERMGQAVWLFMWCVARQTGTHDDFGIVLNGKPITYQLIHQQTKFPERTLKRWMAVLESEKYILVERQQRGMFIRICNSRKRTHMDRKSTVRGANLVTPDVPEVAPQTCQPWHPRNDFQVSIDKDFNDIFGPYSSKVSGKVSSKTLRASPVCSFPEPKTESQMQEEIQRQKKALAEYLGKEAVH